MNKVFDLILDQNKIFVNEIFYYHLREICIQENFKINISIQFEGKLYKYKKWGFVEKYKNK